MYKSIQFNINPIIYLYNDNDDKKLLFNNLEKNLKDKIIKDLLSSKFKNYLYDIIFNVPVNDYNDISQYIDGKILNISYNKEKSNFSVKCNIFISKKIPKVKHNVNQDVLDNKDYKKLFTKKNITKMIKSQINHFYNSRGHYKKYKFNNYDVYVNLLKMDIGNTNVINNININ